MKAPASPPAPASISHAPLIYVRHPMPGDFIELVSVRHGEPRSLVLSEKRALGLIQQLAPCVESTRRFPIFDYNGARLGDIDGDRVLLILSDLARAVHTNRLHERRQRNGR